MVLGAGSWLAMNHHNSPQDSPGPAPQMEAARKRLSLGPAQLDTETTDAAIAAIRNGTTIPAIASLSDRQKMEIVIGERRFYRVPVAGRPTDESIPGKSPLARNPDSTSDPAVSDKPSTSNPATPPLVSNPTLGPATNSRPLGRDGKVRVDFNGALYADYDLSTDLSSICIPVKLGDDIGVTCLSAGQEHRFIVFRIVCTVGPVESEPLYPGDRQSWTVAEGTADYTHQLPWLRSEAANGNSIAEDGLGYVYQNGMGVTQDMSQAVHWYRRAADHGNSDAQTRLRSLGY
jgi:hypothetical protein